MAIIEVKKLYKSYGEKTVISDLSLSIEKGEMIAITGDSGCGKTTLLNIIGLLESCDSGNVIIDNKSNIKPNSINAGKMLRKSISYLFQNFALIEDETVKDNLMLALRYTKGTRSEKNKKIKKALERLGLNGYENKKIYRLSGGEQQRVAITRVMLKPGDIVLADEPTGSLDIHNRDLIVSLLRELNHDGKTIVIVTHDMNVAEKCDRVIQL